MRFNAAPHLSIIAAMLGLPPVVEAQSTRVTDLGVGKLLVAPRDSPDPNFAKAVILLVEFDENGAVGLLINYKTKVPISRALDKLKAANRRSDPVYLGGPVEMQTVLALLRASTRPEDARRLVGDVYLITNRPALEQTLAAGTGPSEFHAYVGYCGWGAGQLENEMNLGAWYIFNGDANLVFDSDPDSVWSRLVVRTEQRIARRWLPVAEGWERTRFAATDDCLVERDPGLRAVRFNEVLDRVPVHSLSIHRTEAVHNRRFRVVQVRQA